MAVMVGSGVVEGLQPDTRHGVEAQLALEDQASMPNIVPHRLDPTHGHLPADAAIHTDPNLMPADAAIHTDPHLMHDPAQVDATQPLPLIEPVTVNHASAVVLHHDEHPDDAHHAVEGLGDAVLDPVGHDVHHAHTGDAEQGLHHDSPGSADPAVGVQPGANAGAVGVQPGANAGAVGAALPVSDDMASGLHAEKHGIHDDVHLRDEQEAAAARNGIFGKHSEVLPQSAGYGGVLSQLLSFGVPVACVFAAVAFVLWKRLGPLRPSTSSVW